MRSQKKVVLTHVKIIGLFLSQVTNGYTEPLATETPKDGVIIDGAGSIHYSNDNTLTIKQNSPSMVSEWKSFNIGENSTVNIEQPQANSKLLNRINDANPTEIHGKLNSNGQVYLLNQQGIIFSKTAKVDVGGIVASSQDLTNENFKADKNEFANKTGTLSEINNEGSINAKDGMVALIAPRVSNSGNIISKNGDVALVSGDKVNIDFRGDGLISVNVDKSTLNAVVENKGLIQAENGSVILNAKSANQLLSSVVNNQGIIEAHSLKNVGGQIILDGDDSNQTQLSGTLDVSSNTGKAGKITVTGHEIILEDNAYLNANGQEGGGDVLIGGDWQGQGNLPQATKVTMQTKAKIDANAIENGHGGKVVLWSDVKNTESTTEIHGEISAKGGAKSGDGGKIETSGHKFDVNDIKINASAPKGKNGEWLIDPVDITIDSTLSAPNTILTSTIVNTLNSGTNVTVSTDDIVSTQVGDINIKNDIIKTTGADATLTLMANHDIILNNGKVIQGAQTVLNVVLHAGINSTEGLVFLDDNSHIYTFGGNVVIGGQSDPLKEPALGHNGLAGITLGTNAHIGTGTGNIILYGKGAAGSPGILLKDNSIIDGNTISLKGIGGNNVGTGGDGIKLQDNVTILSKNNITESGQGGNGATGGNGISLNNNNLITAKNQIDFTNTSGTGGVDFYVSPTKSNTIGYYPIDATYNSSHISFRNDTMNLADIKVQALQDLIIQPRTANTTIGIGGAGTLQIPYQKLLSGFPSLIIGSPTSGNINISGTVNFTNSVVMISGGDITIANGSSIATNQANGYLALSAGGNFINYAGPNALKTTDAGANDRWIVYSKDPTTTVFDGLGLPNSSQALFAPTPPVNILTNSYVFATGTKITANATYGDLNTLNYNGVAALNLLTPATLNALKSIGTLNTGNYPIGIASSLGSLVITPASLAISANAKSKSYGDADPPLTYTALGFKGNDTVGVLFGGLSRAIGEGVGSYVISSSLMNANYAINYTPANFDITPASLTISANAKSKSYGEIDPPLTYTALGFKGNDTVGVLFGGLSRAIGEGVGSYVISSSLMNSNYAINYTPANFDITPASLAISAAAKSKIYGDADPLLTYTALGFKGNDTTAVLTGGLSRAIGEGVGTYKIASSLANANYAINYTPENLKITPASLAISAAAQSKIYGDADPLLTYSASGFKRSDSTKVLTGGLSRADGEDVGTYSIASSLVNPNYAINYTPANFDISPAFLEISAIAQSKLYGDADPLLTYSASGFKGNDTAGNLFGGLSRTDGENVGTYSIASSLVNTNYTISYTPANFDITPASLTISANAKSKLYGDADPLLTYTVSGFKGSDTTGNLSGGLSRADGENVGTYSIASSLVNPNYAISYTPANFDITPASLTISAIAKSKLYGDADPLLTYTALGFKRSDTTDNLSGGLSRADGENVGTYSIASSLVNANYAISYTPANFNITPASLTISAIAKSKLYGDADPLLTYTASGFKRSDTTEDLTGGLSRTDGEKVGTYSIASSLVNPNYAISYTPANFDITPASLTISAIAKSKLYGDADPLLTYTASGFKRSDSTEVLTGGLSRTDGENVGTYSIASSLVNSNYDISYTPANFDITPASLTISANAKSKLYGDADPLLTYTASGFKRSDTTEDLSGGLSRADGENVGTYSIASSLMNPNYAISYTPANFDINPIILNGSLVGKVKKPFDGTDVATLLSSNYHITGFINDDNVLIINSSAVFENSSIGKNKKITANFLPTDFIPLNNTLLNNYTLPTSIVGNIGEITQNSKTALQSFECSTVNPSMLLGSVTVNKTEIDIDSINNQGFIIGSATISIANNGVLSVTNAINNDDVSQLKFIDFQGTESPSNLANSQKNEQSVVENNQKNDNNNTNLMSALAKKGTPNSPLINSIKSQEKQNAKKQQEDNSLSNSISNDFLSNPSSSIYGIDRLENKLTQLASQKNIPSETAKIASHSFISVLTQNLAKGVLMRESLKLAEQSFNEFITNQALPTSTSKFKDFLTNAKNEDKLMYQHDANESIDVNTWNSIVNNQLAKGKSIEQAFENANSAMGFEQNNPNRDVNEKIKKLEKKSSVFDQILGQLLIEKIPLEKSIESANTLYNQVKQPIMNKEAKLVEDISIINNNSKHIFKQKDFDKSFQSLMAQGTPVVKAIEILSKDNNDLSQNNTPYSDKPKTQLATGKLNDFLIDPSVDKTLNAMIKRDYALLPDINTLNFKPTEEKFNPTKSIHSILATGKNIDSIINDEVQNQPFNHALNNTLTKGISIDHSISLALGTEHKNIFVTHLPLAYSHELKQFIANHKNSFPAWINYESTSDRLIIHDIPKNVHLPFSIILSNKYTIEITKNGFQFK
ncbi:MAG: hypothetical protein RLZZ66_1312 [Pseudomonadota bacterium]|jgi:filamentous hemagglutinin family protein